MSIRSTVFALFSLIISTLAGQPVLDYSSGNILQQLEKVNTLGSVLYLAAHPDDENTQLIAYLANGRHYRTAYLSATRGDGGQNLIGPEIREELGLIRTEELLAARSVDHGEQFFSRANDFGYSKNPDETFNKWDKQQVLADFVWTIRKFQPDILITRFSRIPGVTHGHHTASAILAMEAFELSGDPKAFPEQLKYVKPWQPKKIFWNTSTWFYRNTGQQFDSSDKVSVDVGAYNAPMGKSYTEISALSRSMHKSQGFGVTGNRGTEYEYFEQWGGPKTADLFGGIDTSWERVEGAENVAYFLQQAKEEFDPAKPEAILGYLLNAREELQRLPDQYWKEVKLREIRQLVLLVTGTYLEITSEQSGYTPGDTAMVNLELINRSDEALTFSSISFSVANEPINYDINLPTNSKIQMEYVLPLSREMAYTNPYWLEKEGTDGMYRVDDQLLRGKPENPAPIVATVALNRDDQYWEYDVPVIYKMNDPVRGEVRKPLVISPPVMANLSAQSLIFGSDDSRSVSVRVIAGKDHVSGDLSLQIPEGWKVSPKSLAYSLDKKGDEAVYTFDLTPAKQAMISKIRAQVTYEGETYDRGRVVIDYDHIPTQTLFPKAAAKVVKLDVKTGVGKHIGYIMGAGDDIPAALRQVGYQVDLLEKDQVTAKNLQTYDAVILGVRAFNTVPWLAFKNKDLFEFVENGGTVVVQYNTSHRLVTENVAPFPLTLSHDRVTVEEAPVKILAPKSAALNYPNKIVPADFDGWVQERGLYFPSQWSEEFTPILGMSDPGESDLKSSLLIAKYGEGYYCYTGLSLFRELPAGVPGAYKLLINMISLGEKTKP